MAAIIGKVAGLSNGSKVPSGHPLKEEDPENATVDLSSLPGKIIVVGVPGAFTPPCSSQVPGYLENASEFQAKGVTGIYIVAVNDTFTTKAWKEKLSKGNAPSLVHFLADDTGAFTKRAGLSFDATGLLGGTRSQRYAAIIQDGTVEQIFVEDEAPSVTVTKADNVLQKL